MKRTFESETGRKLEEVFSEFEEAPIASASMAQVHRARLRSTGELVAVKVQHDELKYQMPGDLRMITMAHEIHAWLFPQVDYRFFAE